jgi:hypothetical protein
MGGCGAGGRLTQSASATHGAQQSEALAAAKCRRSGFSAPRRQQLALLAPGGGLQLLIDGGATTSSTVGPMASAMGLPQSRSSALPSPRAHEGGESDPELLLSFWFCQHQSSGMPGHPSTSFMSPTRMAA